MFAQGEDQVTSVTCLHQVFVVVEDVSPDVPMIIHMDVDLEIHPFQNLFGPPNCHHRKRVVRLANESLDEHLVVWDSVRTSSRQLGRDFELKRTQDATGQPNQGESRNKEGTGRIKIWGYTVHITYQLNTLLAINDEIVYPINLMFFGLVFFFTLDLLS